MHISHAGLRFDAQRINIYASASMLDLRANCTILRNPTLIIDKENVTNERQG